MSQATTKTTTIEARGMSCQKCAGRVKNSVGAEAGVQDVSVDLTTGRVTVVSDEATPAAALAEAVKRAGYGVASVA